MWRRRVMMAAKCQTYESINRPWMLIFVRVFVHIESRVDVRCGIDREDEMSRFTSELEFELARIDKW
jgi:hypothetical protein